MITWPADDRREFITELAQQVGVERRRNGKPYTRAARELVPHIASAFCPEPLVLFDELVDATEQLRIYDESPRWNRESDEAEQKVERLIRQIIDGPIS